MSDKLDRELRRRMKTRSRFTTLLVLYFCAALILPNCILANTEHYGWWSVEALILMPLGFYMMWSVALRRSGVMIWLAFPFIFFCAFQIVLLYLFGNSIIATDMFTNVLTTNPGEAGELLSNIYPSVLFVCALYVPLLWLAAREIAHRRYISRTTRLTTGLTGAALFALGTLALWPAYRASDTRHVLRDEVFPVNVIYNVGLCASEFRKTSRFERTSADFTYAAERTAEAPGREIYVYIIGEASRAMNWQLYGYERPTTPRLAELDDVVLFRDVLTQSNTTHKSVPLILSSVDTHEHEELYRRRGLPALFNEAGFETWFLSNQAPQGAMIDHLAHDARHVEYLGAPRFDEQLLDSMKRIVASCTAPKLLFILHCYGSHFSYHQRYPRRFARYLPDDDVAISEQNIERIRNAYDNSVLYTDHFLAETIGYLRSLDGVCSALLYCADHGEDLLDDERRRFLHASPTTTAYQLHVAALAWFSEAYRQRFPAQAEAACRNSDAPATTHALFHTMAGMASIRGNHISREASLVDTLYDRRAPRRYLNDHNEAVPHWHTGLDSRDSAVFACSGVRLERP
ncbi:lipid A phosphoethanolamine transferase [uncultured Alistipes sp.]|uniref:lipid A phosphoethanolamine transferase n=1 Tax=uncultured Alistipes sp. TaxID=538949 RepID=UPI00261EF3C1|nr:lipid A phosphoethanolamine transferase [uncultured Alistipes sp.]